jgi:hypothetical protein
MSRCWIQLKKQLGCVDGINSLAASTQLNRQADVRKARALVEKPFSRAQLADDQLGNVAPAFCGGFSWPGLAGSEAPIRGGSVFGTHARLKSDPDLLEEEKRQFPDDQHQR